MASSIKLLPPAPTAEKIGGPVVEYYNQKGLDDAMEWIKSGEFESLVQRMLPKVFAEIDQAISKDIFPFDLNLEITIPQKDIPSILLTLKDIALDAYESAYFGLIIKEVEEEIHQIVKDIHSDGLLYRIN